MKYKVNTNLMFSLPSKLLILIINAESCFSKATPTLILLVAMSTSEPILSTNSLPAMAARHAEEFQVCVLERP